MDSDSAPARTTKTGKITGASVLVKANSIPSSLSRREPRAESGTGMGMRDRPIQGFAAVAGGLSAAFGAGVEAAGTQVRRKLL